VKPLRVLVLMHASLVPPEGATPETAAEADWKTEFDVTHALGALGHEVRILGMGDDLRSIRGAMDEWRPHLAFNLLEDFHDVPIFDQNVVSYLELLRLSYTGCNPRGLMLARDKALAKQILAYHRVPVPDFTVIRMGRRVTRPKRLGFPLIVKSLTQEASTGIAQASVVDDDQKLAQRVQFIHDHVGTDAIVERYIEGRELYVGVLGNERLQVFPVWEIHFRKMADAARPIATDRVKWNPAYRKKHDITTGAAEDLPEAAAERIQHLCRRVCRSLGLTGYCRVDCRMDAEGKVYVLEANPNPQVAEGEDFAASAARAGIPYQALIQRIVSLGLRWRPARVP
jgi:D-alanine-D-alanine ligase